MSARQYVSRLDNIIEGAPKEGYKAAVVLGVINSVRTLVEDLDELARKIKCIAEARERCKDGFCRPGCGGLVADSSGGSLVLGKYKGNTFGAIMGSDGVEVRVNDAKMRLTGVELELYFPAGEGWTSRTVRLDDYDAVYQNSYAIKYVMKKLSRPVRKSIEAISECGKRQAIVC
ncbi:MAG: hypothetical protein F7B18_02190 [Desulfurococcales archaeon]|nr:hypothetical protein [Desulfurococcales archaeon]